MTTWLYSYSRHTLEGGRYFLYEAKDEKGARKAYRDAHPGVRSTRGAFVAEADWVVADLERLVALNETGVGFTQALERRRSVLLQLRTELTARRAKEATC